MSWSYVFMGFLGVAMLAGVTLLAGEVRSKYLMIWLGSYMRKRAVRSDPKKSPRSEAPVHVLFCLVDHFEPIRTGSTREKHRERMHRWLDRFPALAMRHRDSHERPVQHSWFYPGEEYDPEILDDLAKLCHQGWGEIELHLHHGHDDAETLRKKFLAGIEHFSKHGALVTQETPPRYAYGFIHGNMALANSRYDPEFCGVDEEIRILKETGCYADFSMPTAPCVSQTKKVNSIYYATNVPGRPKSHNWGVDVETGRPPTGDLMIIQGPIGFNWHSRKFGIIPRIENAELQESNPATLSRIRTWVRQHVHVKGRPEWVVVKVSCHGAEDQNADVLLGKSADQMYSDLEREYRDREGYCLHYVTARELYNIIKAAEAGMAGDPSLYRDFEIPPYRTHGR
jgi:hypothetical protein